MSLTITEANAVNTVLRYLLGVPGATGTTPTDDQARDAAVELAARANKTLGAGLTADNVTRAWPRVQVCPAQEESPA